LFRKFAGIKKHPARGVSVECGKVIEVFCGIDK
jgi:hypothetical protein